MGKEIDSLAGCTASFHPEGSGSQSSLEYQPPPTPVILQSLFGICASLGPCAWDLAAGGRQARLQGDHSDSQGENSSTRKGEVSCSG